MLVVTFAAGMAWVESACVYYLRVMVDRVEPYQPDPLPIRGILGEVELMREGATLLMLAMTGILARPNVASATGLHSDCLWLLGHSVLRLPAHHLWLARVPVRLGHSLSVAAAVVGPVLAPVSIASLMILWGTLVTQWQGRKLATRFTRASRGLSGAGILLALGVFMADSIHALPGGLDTVRQVLPTAFNWPMFGAALLLMATPLAHTGWRLLSSHRFDTAGVPRRPIRD